jgi:peroxiredoxin
MTSECRTIISEFKKIPVRDLSLSLAVINCDDFNDHRKFMKKNSGLSFALLSDPSKAMMDSTKCRANKRLASALMFIEKLTGKIIKIWYENDWDALTTKDLLVDEVKLYRKNPTQYLQNQIGLR